MPYPNDMWFPNPLYPPQPQGPSANFWLRPNPGGVGQGPYPPMPGGVGQGPYPPMPGGLGHGTYTPLPPVGQGGYAPFQSGLGGRMSGLGGGGRTGRASSKMPFAWPRVPINRGTRGMRPPIRPGGGVPMGQPNPSIPQAPGGAGPAMPGGIGTVPWGGMGSVVTGPAQGQMGGGTPSYPPGGYMRMYRGY